MILLTFLPEISTGLMLIFMGTQVPQIGPILILLELGLVGLLLIFRTRTFIETLTGWWWLLLMPALCMISALWSELPAMSARYGAQFLFTAFVGVLLARLLTPRRFVIVMCVAMFAFVIMSIIFGRQGPSAEGMVLIGLTGSKNQMGYAGQLLFLAGLAVLLMGNISIRLRWIAALALPLGAFIVAGTHSATAVLMTFGGSVVLWTLWFSQRLPPGGRLWTLVGLVVVVTPFIALIPEIIAFINHFIFDTLNKDPTLTGRTVLWDVADDLIRRRPVFGYGYMSFWMSESPDSMRIKHLFGIADGRTFHFHHQFRQVAVDTGLIGLVAFSGALVAAGVAAVRQVLLRPDVATSFFFVIYALMVARAFTDILITPFSMHTILFFAALTYAFYRPQEAVAEGSVQARARRRAWAQSPGAARSR